MKFAVYNNRHRRNLIKLNQLLITFLLLSCCLTGNAQLSTEESDTTEFHELTIFVLRSASPLNWESPATLYQSYKKSLLTNFTKKERTLKGHFFIRLTSPILKEPLFAGVVPAEKKEEKKLMFIDKIGFSVFGIAMKGKIHGRDATLKKIEVHKKNQDIAYLKIRLSPSATKQIIRFYDSYTTEIMSGISRSDLYGGAFWPIYENEGAGCSSFALAILDLVDVHEFETGKWLKTVYIPMELIGGEMNDSKKVKIRTIKKTDQWANGSGIENIDFVRFDIYDPSTAFYWILDKHNNENTSSELITAQTENEIPGLFIDKSNIEFDTTAPIIRKRPDNNFFVDFHLEKLEKQKQQSASLNQ